MAASSLSSQDDQIIYYHGIEEESASVPVREALRYNLSGRPLFAAPSSDSKSLNDLRAGDIVGGNQVAKYGSEALVKSCLQFLGFGNGTTRLTPNQGYPRSTIAVCARGALPLYNIYITRSGRDLVPGSWLYVMFVTYDLFNEDKSKAIGVKTKWYGLGDREYARELLAADGFEEGTDVSVQLFPVARVLHRTKGLTLEQFKRQSLSSESAESGKAFSTVHALITV